MVERYNRTLTETLAKLAIQTKTHWDEHIPAALFAYRTAKQDTTKYTPFDLTYGRQATLPIELQMITLPNTNDGNFETDLNIRIYESIYVINDKRLQAKENIEIAQEKQKQRHDQNLPQNEYNTGDKVLVYRSRLDKQWSGKLEPKWDGPYTIHQKLNNGAYQLSDANGVHARYIHGNRLKPYNEQKEQFEDESTEEEGEETAKSTPFVLIPASKKNLTQYKKKI